MGNKIKDLAEYLQPLNRICRDKLEDRTMKADRKKRVTRRLEFLSTLGKIGNEMINIVIAESFPDWHVKMVTYGKKPVFIATKSMKEKDFSIRFECNEGGIASYMTSGDSRGGVLISEASTVVTEALAVEVPNYMLSGNERVIDRLAELVKSSSEIAQLVETARGKGIFKAPKIIENQLHACPECGKIPEKYESKKNVCKECGQEITKDEGEGLVFSCACPSGGDFNFVGTRTEWGHQVETMAADKKEREEGKLKIFNAWETSEILRGK